ncbi:chromatin remodeling protein SHL-like [Bidens hawaiensis]|uniref:chromatin remodeling protein SHL-like n=1 Tax=Bidens hawaiensis TaxID=980011 RepID=UPI00404AC964
MFTVFLSKTGEDDVLVIHEGRDAKLWIAKVKKFVGNKARILWYYMPEETEYDRLPFQGKNEILYSDHTDYVSIYAIENNYKVYSEEQHEDFKEVDADVYLCRSKYDPVNKVFTEDTNFTVYATLFT